MDDQQSRQVVLISVKFPQQMLDETADALNLDVNLNFSITSNYVKESFLEDYQHHYISFDADEK